MIVIPHAVFDRQSCPGKRHKTDCFNFMSFLFKFYVARQGADLVQTVSALPCISQSVYLMSTANTADVHGEHSSLQLVCEM